MRILLSPVIFTLFRVTFEALFRYTILGTVFGF